MRSAFGAGGIAFFVLLMLAGSNDVLAKFLQVEVDTLNTVLKVLLFVVPIVAGVLTWWICRDLRCARRTTHPGAVPGDLPSQRRGRVRRGTRPVHRPRADLAVTRRRWMGLVATIAVATTACSSSFGMPRGSSSQGEEVFSLWQIFFWAAIGVAAIVYGLLGWSLLRYRRRRGDDDTALGRQFHANIPLEIVYTAIPVAIVVVLFTLSVRGDDRVSAVSADPDVTLHVEAYQWGWRFSFPDEGVGYVSQPSGEGIPGPDHQLPVGETIRVELTSNDVIHAFWVPDFLFKRDAIPGHVNVFDISPTVTAPTTASARSSAG